MRALAATGLMRLVVVLVGLTVWLVASKIHPHRGESSVGAVPGVELTVSETMTESHMMQEKHKIYNGKPKAPSQAVKAKRLSKHATPKKSKKVVNAQHTKTQKQKKRNESSKNSKVTSIKDKKENITSRSRKGETPVVTAKKSGKVPSTIKGKKKGDSKVALKPKSAPKAKPRTTALGVDISTPLTAEAARCLIKRGFSFVIPRGYQSNGVNDPNACASLGTAAAASMSTRDAYMFPCPTCSTTAAQQVHSLVSHLRSTCNHAWSGRIWLDIEGSQYWKGYTYNQQFFIQLVKACTSSGAKCGVYASSSQWSSLFGSSFHYGNNLPLWYAHYDNKPNFSDWPSVAFGGWKRPFAKQYQDTTAICGVSVDLDYSPYINSA